MSKSISGKQVIGYKSVLGIPLKRRELWSSFLTAHFRDLVVMRVDVVIDCSFALEFIDRNLAKDQNVFDLHQVDFCWILKTPNGDIIGNREDCTPKEMKRDFSFLVGQKVTKIELLERSSYAMTFEDGSCLMNDPFIDCEDAGLWFCTYKGRWSIAQSNDTPYPWVFEVPETFLQS